MSIVTLVTGYLFYRILTTKKKEEPDSYSENDDIKSWVRKHAGFLVIFSFIRPVINFRAHFYFLIKDY